MPTQRHFVHRSYLIGLVILSLWPFLHYGVEWVRVSQVIDEPVDSRQVRGFDWVQWEDRDGRVTAVYVFPNGTAHQGGIQEGDQLIGVDVWTLFTAEDFKNVIEAMEPGSTIAYELLRDNHEIIADVRITAYPTFLYPLSGGLWQASVWGFAVVSFFHLIALIIIIPVGFKSRPGRFALWLIVTSSAWVFGNLTRILMLLLMGPTDTVEGSRVVFEFLTMFSLLGWISFPALLLYSVVTSNKPDSSSTWLEKIVFIPGLLLAVLLLYTEMVGPLGPFARSVFVPGALFYTSAFIGGATLAQLSGDLFIRARPQDSETPVWSRAGTIIVFLSAIFFSLAILDAMAILSIGKGDEISSGRIIVSAQLFTTAPVILLTHATLKYGKVDEVLSRALSYLFGLGVVFFLYVGGRSLIDSVPAIQFSPTILAGLLVMILVLLFEAMHGQVRRYLARLLRSKRQMGYLQMVQFGERMFSIADHETLASESLGVVLPGVRADSGALVLKTNPVTDDWIRYAEGNAASLPLVQSLWPHFEHAPRLWAIKKELSDNDIPLSLEKLLAGSGVHLVIPIPGGKKLVGLLLLGHRSRKRSVYNLTDIDYLRTLCNQIGLSAERIELLDREKELIRETAEAHLVALRAQINPHFLFNALNTIAALIDENPEAAEANVEHLSQIFRHTLKIGGMMFVSLREELSLVDHYLAIEQARFGKRLQIERTIAPGLSESLVPPFAVQTVVENAIKHGLEKSRNTGVLGISAKKNDAGDVEIVVSDTGRGIAGLFGKGQVAQAQPFYGTGLENVYSRLLRLYQRDDLLRIESAESKGTIVTMVLPSDDSVENGNLSNSVNAAANLAVQS